ncbi:exosome complex RNA-binding protein Csl4 [Candidatus Micrarchaeota archaeon]|nr:exosome complex RNA-binding protein Csl4 [Candidatus Micrarchaeota archaeon]
MTDKKKIVLPGDYLSSYEEAEPGDNAYSANDDVYSAAVGEQINSEGKANVQLKHARLEQPHPGMDVYCVVVKTTPTKAISSCISVNQAEGKGRGLEMDAVLDVTNIRRGYVRDIRDEVKVGDIIKGKIQKVTKQGIDISIFPSEYGIVRAFCPRCRHAMDLKENLFICICGWKENRKIPGVNSQGNEEGF